ncbi:MAG: hypothetical protein RR426_04255 [Oscillospiraceae bacterium]
MQTATQPLKTEDPVRVRKPGDEHHGPTSTFYLEPLTKEPEKSGASAAVLSAWESPAVSEMTLADNTGEEPGLAQEEQLGFGGKFSRFFSRRVDFRINDTQILGKNGFQVRGGALTLAPGAALDLTPATLTGRREGKLSSADGVGAQLYLATGGNVTRQPLKHVYVDSDQTIDAQGTEPARFTLPTHELELGAVHITQRKGTPEIRFDSATLTGGTDGGGTSVGGAALQDGKLVMEQLNLPACQARLYGLTLTEKELRFRRGEIVGEKKTVTLESDVVDDTLPGRLAAKRMAETAATVQAAATAVAAMQGLFAQGDAPIAPAEEETVQPQKTMEKATVQPKKTAAGNLLLLDALDYHPEEQKGTADLILSASLLTRGEYGLNFGTVTAATEGTEFTLNDQGLITADLEDLELTVKNEELGDYQVLLTQAALTDDVFSAKEVQVEKSKDGSRIEAEADSESPLAQMLTFSIPKMPERVAFSKLKADGRQLEADKSTVMQGLYRAENVGGMFSAELDLAKRAFEVSMTKEENLTKSGFFSKGSIPLAEVPILPGLTFGLSLQPSANMSGSFGVKGAFPESEAKPWFLAGGGTFQLAAGIGLNADLELGAGSVAGLYVGLTGEAKATAEASLQLSLSLGHANDKLTAESLGIDGGFEAALTGSIGAHAGVKLLFWEAELFSYTFKEWEIAKLALSAAITKDMQQGFTKGWKLENSSFTAEAFGKLLTKDTLNIRANREMLVEAIQLEGDYEKLKDNLKAVVAGYQKLQANLVGTGGKGLLLDVETVQAQRKALLSLGEQLEKHAEEAKTQDEALHNNFVMLAAELTKKRSETAVDRQKHGDRKQLLSNAQKLMQNQENLSYKEALAAAKAPTRAEIQRQELRKLGVISVLLEHEEKRLAEYILKSKEDPEDEAYQAGVSKHKERMNLLLEAKKDGGGREDEVLRLLAFAPGEKASGLRYKLHRATGARMSELSSMKGFYGSSGENAKENFEKKSDTERISARLEYETGRYEYYDDQTLHQEMDLVAERLLRLSEIQKESLSIRGALAPLAGLKGGGQADADAVFQDLQALLQVGVNLDKTAVEFDYVKAAQSSRDTQRDYLKAVQAKIR